MGVIMADKNIYQRMLAIMTEIGYVRKESKKVNNQYTFVSHDAVAAKIRPALIKHGVLAVPSVKSNEIPVTGLTVATMVTTFYNVDNPEEFIEVETFGHGIDKQDKGPGKAMSYAFKYALLKAFCLETGDDPERDLNDLPKKEEQILSDSQFLHIDDAIGVKGVDKKKIIDYINDSKNGFGYTVKKINDIRAKDFDRISGIIEKAEGTKKETVFDNFSD